MLYPPGIASVRPSSLKVKAGRANVPVLCRKPAACRIRAGRRPPARARRGRRRAGRQLDPERPAARGGCDPMSAARRILNAIGSEREAALSAQWLATEATVVDRILDRRDPLRAKLTAGGEGAVDNSRVGSRRTAPDRSASAAPEPSRRWGLPLPAFRCRSARPVRDRASSRCNCTVPDWCVASNWTWTRDSRRSATSDWVSSATFACSVPASRVARRFAWMPRRLRSLGGQREFHALRGERRRSGELSSVAEIERECCQAQLLRLGDELTGRMTQRDELAVDGPGLGVVDCDAAGELLRSGLACLQLHAQRGVRRAVDPLRQVDVRAMRGDRLDRLRIEWCELRHAFDAELVHLRRALPRSSRARVPLRSVCKCSAGACARGDIGGSRGRTQERETGRRIAAERRDVVALWWACA